MMSSSKESATALQDQQQPGDNDNDDTENKEVVKEDDWGLAMDFTLFARHERRKIKLSSSSSSSSATTFFEIDCVESLTPLDMMHLMNGTHDSTGHCVWTGAFFFLQCLPTLFSFSFGKGGGEEEEHVTFFANKRVLELGTGTGIAGIGLLLSLCCSSLSLPLPPKLVCMTDADPDALELCRRNCLINHDAIVRATTGTTCSATSTAATTTDAYTGTNNDDAEVLHQKSVDVVEEQSPPPPPPLPSCVRVESLTWQTDPVEFFTLSSSNNSNRGNSSSNLLQPHSFDTVFAADVLYDIAMLPAIIQTARACLKQKQPPACARDPDNDVNGESAAAASSSSSSVPSTTTSSSCYFILSHVPRACYTSEYPAPVHDNNLQDYIVQQAKCHGDFELLEILRPLDLLPVQQQHGHEAAAIPTTTNDIDSVFLNNISLQEMHDIGACLFIFQTIAQRRRK
jgi:predicted nicotinamide N-methyase